MSSEQDSLLCEVIEINFPDDGGDDGSEEETTAKLPSLKFPSAAFVKEEIELGDADAFSGSGLEVPESIFLINNSDGDDGEEEREEAYNNKQKLPRKLQHHRTPTTKFVKPTNRYDQSKRVPYTRGRGRPRKDSTNCLICNKNFPDLMSLNESFTNFSNHNVSSYLSTIIERNLSKEKSQVLCQNCFDLIDHVDFLEKEVESAKRKIKVKYTTSRALYKEKEPHHGEKMKRKGRRPKLEMSRPIEPFQSDDFSFSRVESVIDEIDSIIKQEPLDYDNSDETVDFDVMSSRFESYDSDESFSLSKVKQKQKGIVLGAMFQ